MHPTSGRRPDDSSLTPLLFAVDTPKDLVNAQNSRPLLALSTFFEEATHPGRVRENWKGGCFTYPSNKIPEGSLQPADVLAKYGFRFPTRREVENQFGTINAWALDVMKVVAHPMFGYERPYVFNGLMYSNTGVNLPLHLDHQGHIVNDDSGRAFHVDRSDLLDPRNDNEEGYLANKPWRVLLGKDQTKVMVPKGARQRRRFTDPLSVNGYVPGAANSPLPDYVTAAERTVQLMNLGNALFWTNYNGPLNRPRLEEVLSRSWGKLIDEGALSDEAEKVSIEEGVKGYISEILDLAKTGDTGLWPTLLPDGRNPRRIIMGAKEVQMLKGWAS